MDLVIPKNRLDQTAAESARKKAYVTAIILALVLASFLLVLTSPVADAEEDAPLKLDGQKTFYLNGTEITADAYSFRGMVYVVTDDTQSAETLGLYGVIPGQTEYVCNVWIDTGDVLYEVTSVVTAKDVTDNFNTGGKELYLADSIDHLEENCFVHLDSTNDIVVAEGCAGITATGYAHGVAEVSSANGVTFTFDKGSITYPQDEYQNQSMESFTVYEDLASPLPACTFEYPWYWLSSWKQGDDAEFASDCASILFHGGKIYVDGDDSGLSVSSGDSVALTAQWEEMGFDGNRYGDYPVIYMYITCVIIIALFIAGVALVIYRANQRRDAA